MTATITTEYRGARLSITANVHKGYAGTWEQPAEPETYEITSITAIDSFIELYDIFDNEAIEHFNQLFLNE